MYTLVSEIHDNVELVLVLKDTHELEGDLSARDSCFKFLNRSVPLYSKQKVILKPKHQTLVSVAAPFSEKFSALEIIIYLD